MKRRLLLVLALVLVKPASAEKLVNSERQDLKARLNTVMRKVEGAAESRRDGLTYRLVKGEMVNAFVPNDDPNQLVFFEGAVANLPEAQLFFLASHEFVHANRKHRASHKKQSIIRGVARVGLAIFTRNSTDEQKADINEASDGLESLAHNQYGQAQEQEADREAVQMLARAGYDPVNAILYFQSQSPKGEEKDVMGTHPTFAARIDDIARHLPRVEFQPAEVTSSKSILAFAPEFLEDGGFSNGSLDVELSSTLYRFLEGSMNGLTHDAVGTQALQGQVSGFMKDETTENYLLKVRRYRSRVSMTTIESDIVSEVARALNSGVTFRAYSIAASRDAVGNRQVVLLLIH